MVGPKVTVSLCGLLKEVTSAGQWKLTLQALALARQRGASKLSAEACFVVARHFEMCQPPPPKHIVAATLDAICNSPRQYSAASVLQQATFDDPVNVAEVVSTCEGLLRHQLTTDVKAADAAARTSFSSTCLRVLSSSTCKLSADARGRVIRCAAETSTSLTDDDRAAFSDAVLAYTRMNPTWTSAFDVFQGLLKLPSMNVVSDQALQQLGVSAIRDCPVNAAIAFSTFMSRSFPRAHSNQALCVLFKKLCVAGRWETATSVFENHAPHIARSQATHIAYVGSLRASGAWALAIAVLTGMQRSTSGQSLDDCIHQLRDFGLAEASTVLLECFDLRTVEPTVAIISELVEVNLQRDHWVAALQTLKFASREAKLIVPGSLIARALTSVPSAMTAVEYLLTLAYEAQAVEREQLGEALRIVLKRHCNASDSKFLGLAVRCVKLLPQATNFGGSAADVDLLRLFARAVVRGDDLRAALAALTHMRSFDAIRVCRALLPSMLARFQADLPIQEEVVDLAIQAMRFEVQCSMNHLQVHHVLQLSAFASPLGLEHQRLQEVLCDSVTDHCDVSQLLLLIVLQSPQVLHDVAIQERIGALCKSHSVATAIFKVIVALPSHIHVASDLYTRLQPFWCPEMEKLASSAPRGRLFGAVAAAARGQHCETNKFLDAVTFDSTADRLVAVKTVCTTSSSGTWQAALTHLQQFGCFDHRMSEEDFSSVAPLIVAIPPSQAWEVALRCVAARWEHDGFPLDAAVAAFVQRDDVPSSVCDAVVALYRVESLIPAAHIH